MRIWSSLAVLAGILLAGCAAPEPVPVVEPEPTPTPPLPEGFRLKQANATNGTDAQRTIFELDVGNLSFDDSLVRYALVADGPVIVNATMRVEVGAHDPLQDGCVAGAFSRQGGDGWESQSGIIVWYYENSFRTMVRSGDTQVEEHPYPERGDAFGAPAASARTTTKLEAGEAFLIEVGGRDARFVQEGSRAYTGSGPNLFHVQLEVEGNAHLEPRPAVAMRCGVGSAQAEAPLLSAKLPFTQVASAQATVGFTPSNASSMVYLGGFDPTPRRIAVRYDAETHPDPPMFARADPVPLEMAVAFEADGGFFPHAFWFMADTHWPFLTGLDGAAADAPRHP